jgi:hypothetical protein
MAILIRRKYNRHVRRNDDDSNDDDSNNEIGGDSPSSPPTHDPYLPTPSRTTTSPPATEFTPRRSPRLSSPSVSSPRRAPRLSNKMKKRHEHDEVQWSQMEPNGNVLRPQKPL